MVRVGIVGIGFMGMTHYLSYQRTPGVEVTAICTRDAAKLAGDWTSIKGNFGPPGQQMDLSGVQKYTQVADLLADDNVDLVDICLPPNLHPDVTQQSFAAGKHVFCEKPIALTTAESQQMMQAAKDADKQLLIGHILPLLPEYAYALEAIRSGKYGKVLGGTFKRVICEPEWAQGYYDPAIVGGPLVDLHVHDAHFIRVVFGMPDSLTSQGRMQGEVVRYCNTLFHYDNQDYTVAAMSGVIGQAGRSFTHGFEIHLEQATLQYELAVIGDEGRMLLPLTVYEPDGTATEVKNESEGDPMVEAFDYEIAEVVRCLESNEPSSVLDGQLALDAVQLCHHQTESVRRGERVTL